jgi:WD40 repeat protein
MSYISTPICKDYIVSISRDTDDARCISIYDRKTKTLINQITEHKEMINSIAYTNDGLLMYTRSVDGIINVWEMSAFNINRELNKYERSLIKTVSVKYGELIVKCVDPRIYAIGDINNIKLRRYTPPTPLFTTMDMYIVATLDILKSGDICSSYGGSCYNMTFPYYRDKRFAFLLGFLDKDSSLTKSYASDWLFDSNLNKLIFSYIN